MARPKKTKIHLDKDSLREFMQEIYNDCSNMMNSARKELNERKNRAEIDDIRSSNDENVSDKSFSDKDKDALRELFNEKQSKDNIEYDLD